MIKTRWLCEPHVTSQTWGGHFQRSLTHPCVCDKWPTGVSRVQGASWPLQGACRPLWGDSHCNPMTSLEAEQGRDQPTPSRNMGGGRRESPSEDSVGGVTSHATPPASPRAPGRAPSPEVVTTLLEACPALSVGKHFIYRPSGGCAATVHVTKRLAHTH